MEIGSGIVIEKGNVSSRIYFKRCPVPSFTRWPIVPTKILVYTVEVSQDVPVSGTV